MRPSGYRTLSLVLISSVLQTLCFPVAGPLPPSRAALAWFALAPLLAALLPTDRVLKPLESALTGYLCGVLWYAGTCYWIYSTMHQYGGLSVAMSLLTTVLFCLYLGLYHALFAWALSTVRRGPGIAAALLASPFLWVAVELARARITSFPWNLLGYAQVDNGLLTALAPVTGVYGLSLVLAAVNAAIACVLVLPRRRVPATFALAAAVLATGVQNAGVWLRPLPMLGHRKAVLMQPNLSVNAPAENEGALAADFSALSRRAASLDSMPTSVILWPESPSPFQTGTNAFTAAAATLAKQTGAPVIAGAIGLASPAPGETAMRMYNSAAVFTPATGYSGRYDKARLVPFGEFVPYAGLFQFASGLTQAVGAFTRGSGREPVGADGHRYGVFICYESIFGDEVRQFAANGADVLVNLSDDGWYGDSSAPFQHLNMARMRAIENRRWLLRDTNNGITASIDPNGRVVETMQRHRRGALAVHFDYSQTTTFYTRHGDWFAYACTLLALSALLCGAVAARRPAGEVH